MSAERLKEICAVKKEFIAQRKSEMPFSAIEDKARLAPQARSVVDALKKATLTGYALILDIKRASPFTGYILQEDYDPLDIAQKAEKAGITCLSVATDKPFHQGSLKDFDLVRENIALPLIRKDFILDPYQIIESRAHGADCITLIMTALDDTQARILEQTAHQWGMNVMIVVQNEMEMDRALSHLGSRLICINNKNWKDGKVSLDKTRNIVKNIPKNYHAVSSGGIKQGRTMESFSREGVRTFMLGEFLLRQENMQATIKKMLSEK